MEVEPTVYLDDEVGIKVALEVSSIVREITSGTGTLTYQIGTRSASTSLRLKDGETQALAGLINDEDRKSAQKVPGLGDLPIVGRLFANHRNDASKTEIILLITPHIVRNLVRPDAAAMEFASGTEASSIGSALGPMVAPRTVTVSPPPPPPVSKPPAFGPPPGGVFMPGAPQPFPR